MIIGLLIVALTAPAIWAFGEYVDAPERESDSDIFFWWIDTTPGIPPDFQVSSADFKRFCAELALQLVIMDQEVSKE